MVWLPPAMSGNSRRPVLGGRKTASSLEPVAGLVQSRVGASLPPVSDAVCHGGEARTEGRITRSELDQPCNAEPPQEPRPDPREASEPDRAGSSGPCWRSPRKLRCIGSPE